ncbi:MAG: GNAT family N-acetyltransferase [Janthinobacterium lividum]
MTQPSDRPDPGPLRAERLFRPRSVVLLGAATADGARLAANLAGFRGRVLRADTPEAVAGLPEAADLALVATPAAEVAPALAALGRRGTTLALVTSAMPGGHAALREAGLAAGVRAMGPNSFGLCVPAIGLNASLAHLPPRAGRVALVSQSASLCRAVLDWSGPNGVGFSHIVGVGNNAGLGLGFAVTLDWLSRDPGTGAILLDMRRLHDRRGFISAARAASRLRPVVAIRPGGRLLDEDGAAEAVFEAALRRAGILCVRRYEDLLAAAETLTRARPARHDTLAIVTGSISLGRLTADAALGSGIALHRLGEPAAAALRASLPVTIERGVLQLAADAPTRLADACAMVSAEPGLGGVLAVLAPTGVADEAGVAALAACAAATRVPLLACVLGESTGAGLRATLADAGLPVFASPEQAVRGFLHLVQQRHAAAAARELPPGTLADLHPDRAGARALLDRAARAGRDVLRPEESLALLAAYGIAVPAWRIARDPGEAAAAALAVGLPVSLERRDARGEACLDADDAAGAGAAARLLLAGGSAEGVLVRHRPPPARALSVHVADDPVFGPAIAFGPGAGAARVVHDQAHELPPLNLVLAHALVGRTDVGRLLATDADTAAASPGAVAETLVRVSQMVVDLPALATLSLDPLLATPAGVVAVAAAVRLRPPPAPAAADLAIAPYPDHLARAYAAPSGEAFLLRPIRPEDAQAHDALFHRLAPEDIRYRFFGGRAQLSAEQTVRLTQVDYVREMAFVATRGADTVGVSRLLRPGPGERATEAEFAVLVEPAAKGQGVATALMRCLLEWAEGQGVARVGGLILGENAPMLAFARRLGFTLARDPDDVEVMRATLDLGG